MTFDLNHPTTARAHVGGASKFLSRVYLKLAGGLTISALTALAIDATPRLQQLLFVTAGGQLQGYTPLGLFVLFAPLAVLLLAAFLIRARTATGAGLVYWSTTVLMGAGLAALGLVFTQDSLATAMLSCGLGFAGLSAWGAVTPRELTELRIFFTNTLLGLVAAIIVTTLVGVPFLVVGVDLLGVIAFSGLVAADTQRLKRIEAEIVDPQEIGAASTYGVLTLYLNAVNLLQFMLGVFGRRK